MKLLFVLVATVCIVSAQAFVKRDAPAAPAESSQDILTLLQKQAEEAQKLINSLGAQASSSLTKLKDDITEQLKPENVQKNVQETISKVQTSLEEIKKKVSETPAKA